MLNKSNGNMYEFVTHTYNTVKGLCYHDCSYCYMKRWGNLKAVRLEEKEFKTNLGKNNFIFVGSSNDMFSKKTPKDWIIKTLNYCLEFNNKYLFQSKNPARFLEPEIFNLLKKFDSITIGTTIESNLFFKES